MLMTLEILENNIFETLLFPGWTFVFQGKYAVALHLSKTVRLLWASFILQQMMVCHYIWTTPNFSFPLLFQQGSYKASSLFLKYIRINWKCTFLLMKLLMCWKNIFSCSILSPISWGTLHPYVPISSFYFVKKICM